MALKKCCCCVDLTLGSKIIGWLTFVGAIISGIYCLANLSNHRDVLAPVTDPIVYDYSTAFNVINGLTLALEFVIGASAICLIIGATKKNTAYIKPYLIIYIICILVTMILSMSVLVSIKFSGPLVPRLIGNIIGSGIQFYFWMCVFSLHQEIREGGPFYTSSYP